MEMELQRRLVDEGEHAEEDARTGGDLHLLK